MVYILTGQYSLKNYCLTAGFLLLNYPLLSLNYIMCWLLICVLWNICFMCIIYFLMCFVAFSIWMLLFKIVFSMDNISVRQLSCFKCSMWYCLLFNIHNRASTFTHVSCYFFLKACLWSLMNFIELKKKTYLIRIRFIFGFISFSHHVFFSLTRIVPYYIPT